MSPRGVAIPEVREQLFAAAERLLTRDGPVGLTSRAITAEAGVAKGLLYAHFADLDDFLAELVASRSRKIADSAADLPARAGHGSVTGNLAEAARLLAATATVAVIGVVLSRPSLLRRLQGELGAGPPVLRGLEVAVANYLEAEKRLGRVAADADSEALGLTLVAAVHHVLLTGAAAGPAPSEHALSERVHRIAAALYAGMTPGTGLPRPR